MPAVRRQVRMMRRRGMPTPGRVQPARGPDARSVAHAVLLRVETTAAFADVLLARAVGGLSAPDRVAGHRSGVRNARMAGPAGPSSRPGSCAARRSPGSIRRCVSPCGSASTSSCFSIACPPTPRSTRSVRLARRAAPGAAGLVNAVLRRAAREGRPDPSTLGPTPADPLGAARRRVVAPTVAGRAARRADADGRAAGAAGGAQPSGSGGGAREHGPCDARGARRGAGGCGRRRRTRAASRPMRWWWNVRPAGYGRCRHSGPVTSPTRARLRSS